MAKIVPFVKKWNSLNLFYLKLKLLFAWKEERHVPLLPKVTMEPEALSLVLLNIIGQERSNLKPPNP